MENSRVTQWDTERPRKIGRGSLRPVARETAVWREGAGPHVALTGWPGRTVMPLEGLAAV